MSRILSRVLQRQVMCRPTLLPTRVLSSSTQLCHGDYEWEEPKSPDDIVNITYVDRDNIEHPIQGKIGDNVLFLAHRHDIDIEGACEAALVSSRDCEMIRLI